MKAKDYCEKYSHITVVYAITEEESFKKDCYNLLNEFLDEAFALKDVRNVSTTSGFVSILKEQNKKWNALIRILGKKDKEGWCPLAEDAFKNIMIKRAPELATEWR